MGRLRPGEPEEPPATHVRDTSPDLRAQLLDAEVDRLDGVLITHDHADHIHGIDDVRPLVIHMRRRIRLYADAVTSGTLMSRFGYCFSAAPGSPYPAILEERRIAVGETVEVEGPGGGVAAVPFDMIHGPSHALGLRFGTWAYAPDVSLMPEESVAQLAGLDLLILDALRYTPHPTHYSVSDALRLIARLRPRRAVLTNLHTDLDYDRLRGELPDGVVPAFDGMKLQA